MEMDEKMLTMTAILPWAATRGDAARARTRILANMFALGGIDLKSVDLKN